MTPTPPSAPILKLFEVCIDCGLADESVVTAPDPYVLEVVGIVLFTPHCTTCYRLRCEDI